MEIMCIVYLLNKNISMRIGFMCYIWMQEICRNVHS